MKEFKKYPERANKYLFLSLLVGIVLTFLLRNPFVILPAGLVGAFLYYQMAKKYRCPHCGVYLWNFRKEELKKCPSCGGGFDV